MLGCIQPISSPMMNRMLGFDVLAACPYAIALPATHRKVHTISVPKANLRKFPLESIRSLLCVVVAQGHIPSVYKWRAHVRRVGRCRQVLGPAQATRPRPGIPQSAVLPESEW